MSELMRQVHIQTIKVNDDNGAAPQASKNTQPDSTPVIPGD
ncbi:MULTISPECIES: hypothetical protein [unclassified Endozoicomonas]